MIKKLVAVPPMLLCWTGMGICLLISELFEVEWDWVDSTGQLCCDLGGSLTRWANG